MTVSIRDATPDDCDVIAHYNSLMSEETEGTPLAADTIHSGVAALLADRSKGRYWVAVDGDRIVGQIMVTYEWSDWRDGLLWWIQSVYVAREFRRRGVFSALYRHVKDVARASGTAAGLRLYVEEENARAQATYRSLGMTMTGYRIMQELFRA